MTKKVISAFLLAVALGMAGVAVAEPTLPQVYETAKSGDLAKAQSMMDEVLKNHPTSAKAHFVEAEVAAARKDLQRANLEMNIAKSLDPSMSFVKPEALQGFQARMAQLNEAQAKWGGEGVPPAKPEVSFAPSGTFKFFVAAGFVLVILLIARAIRGGGLRPINRALTPAPTPGFDGNRGFVTSPSSPAAQPMGGAPTGFDYPAPPQPSSSGHGILGTLATGAALGAGMVAGESLMHKVFDSDKEKDRSDPAPTYQDIPSSPDDTQRYDMGGDDFGVQDTGSWDSGSSDSGSSSGWSDSGGGGDFSSSWD